MQFQTAGPCSQLLTLLSKHTTLSLRDPMLYVGRMGFFLIANLFFAIIYVHARQRKQVRPQARRRVGRSLQTGYGPQ